VIKPPEVAGPKPRLRGVFHEIALFVSIPTSTALIILARGWQLKIACLVFGISMALMFGCSTLLHRVNWSPSTLNVFKRLDHSMIFVGIAGTYTPITVGGLSHYWKIALLIAAWLGAAAGILIRLLWLNAPRFWVISPYVLVGWMAIAAILQFWRNLGVAGFTLMLLGGISYSCGAAVYALKRPDPNPRVFGFHEVFHLLTVLAALLFYVEIFRIVA
jgi:hemolysin III